MTETNDDAERANLDRLAAGLVRAAGPRLLSLVVYGDGRQLMAVLDRADLPLMQRLAAPFRGRWREIGAEPFVVTRSELARLADVFPLRLWHVQRSHVLLHGEDVVSAVVIEPAHLRLRLEQTLRNRLLRLRRHLVLTGADARSLVPVLVGSAHALEIELAALASLEDAPRDLGLDALLAELRALEQGESPDDPLALCGRLLEGLERTIDAADRLADV